MLPCALWIFIAALLYSGCPPSLVLVSIRSPKYCGKMQSEGWKEFLFKPHTTWTLLETMEKAQLQRWTWLVNVGQCWSRLVNVPTFPFPSLIETPKHASQTGVRRILHSWLSWTLVNFARDPRFQSQQPALDGSTLMSILFLAIFEFELQRFVAILPSLESTCSRDTTSLCFIPLRYGCQPKIPPTW